MVPELQSEAEEYNQNSVLQREVGHLLLEALRLKEGDHVLDLGCGTGYLASLAAQKVGPAGKVVAVDPDPQRIEIAQQKYRDLTNVSLLEGSSDHFPEGPYDAVYSNFVFLWVKDKEAAFRNIHRSLKTGGLCKISTWFELPSLLRELFDLMGPERSQRLYERYFLEPMESYETLANASGLQVMEKLPLSTKLIFPTLDNLFKSVYGATHGLFDPAAVESEDLEKFKSRWFKDNHYEADLTTCGAIVTVKKVESQCTEHVVCMVD